MTPRGRIYTRDQGLLAAHWRASQPGQSLVRSAPLFALPFRCLNASGIFYALPFRCLSGKKARRPGPGLFTRGRAQTPPSARHMPGCLAVSALSRFVLSGPLPALAGSLAGVTLTWIALARPLTAFVGLLTA